jgi:hypothetical protein
MHRFVAFWPGHRLSSSSPELPAMLRDPARPVAPAYRRTTAGATPSSMRLFMSGIRDAAGGADSAFAEIQD